MRFNPTASGFLGACSGVSERLVSIPFLRERRIAGCSLGRTSGCNRGPRGSAAGSFNKKTDATFAKRRSLLLVFLVCCNPDFSRASTDYQFWYTSPGDVMGTSALPIGNGHIGMWALCGAPDSDVASMCNSNLYNGDTAGMASFGRFNNVHINHPNDSDYSNFKRCLDIGEATLSISYTAHLKNYHSEFIASYPDSCIIGHLTCGAPGGVSIAISISDEHPSHATTVSTAKSESGVTLINTGRMNHSNIPAVGIEQRIFLRKLGAGGTVSATGNTLIATDCDSVDIFIAIADQFKDDASVNYVSVSPTAHQACSTMVANASARTYAQLRARHIADYQNLFNRFSLDLNSPVSSMVPTDQRWANYKHFSGGDNGFMVLMHQYGRYLMISCSRNCLPPGLIGLWDNSTSSAWTGAFYTDVNDEIMWGSLEANNLAECAVPFINFLNNIRPALRFYSKTADPGDRGYVCWRVSNPYGGGGGGQGYEAGVPWNLHYAYDHFRFDQDTAFLHASIYPNMKEVSQHLIDHQKLWNGKYATINGWSPENGDPPQTATAHDGQTTWDLLTNTVEAAAILGIDSAFRDTLAARIGQINDGISHIGPNGDLLEFDNSTGNSAGQRHISHLFCIEPGWQISPLLDETKFAAAKKALVLRIRSVDWLVFHGKGKSVRPLPDGRLGLQETGQLARMELFAGQYAQSRYRQQVGLADGRQYRVQRGGSRNACTEPCRIQNSTPARSAGKMAKRNGKRIEIEKRFSYNEHDVGRRQACVGFCQIQSGKTVQSLRNHQFHNRCIGNSHFHNDKRGLPCFQHIDWPGICYCSSRQLCGERPKRRQFWQPRCRSFRQGPKKNCSFFSEQQTSMRYYNFRSKGTNGFRRALSRKRARGCN